MDQASFGSGAKGAMPMCLGVIPVGISYGLLAVQAGLSHFQAVLMSILVMAGSSQLMAVSMIGQAAIISIITAVFFVNLRHIVMSCSVMSQLGKTSLWQKLLCAFALCDESFALFSISGNNSYIYLLGMNTALYGTWVLSSLAGCMMGQLLPQFVSRGFGIAFYAAFLAILVPNTVKNRGIFYLVLLTAGMNAILQLFLPASWAVILSMIAGTAISTFFVEPENNEQP